MSLVWYARDNEGNSATSGSTARTDIGYEQNRQYCRSATGRKTTLVRDLITTARFVTLDDDGARAALAADPYGQLLLFSDEAKISKRPVVLDEIQRLPEITLALKRIVDTDRRPGQFVLTGSSDIFWQEKRMIRSPGE